MRFLRLVSRLVPEASRADWIREWEAEFRWYRRHRSGRWQAARRLLGAVTHAWWLRSQEWRLDMLGYDLRDALRSLVRRPWFSAMTALTLALAVGAATAIFSVVDAVLLRPLPFEEPHRIAALQYRYTDTGRQNDYISIPDFNDWRRARAFSTLAAVDWPQTSTIASGDLPERVAAARATTNVFDVFGVKPAAGRLFRPDDGVPGPDDVVVLSHTLWQRRFGGDPGLIGRRLVIDDLPVSVVGVLPAGLDLPTPADLWRPLSRSSEDARRRVNLLKVFGRLAPGASFADAQTEMSALARQLELAYPATNEHHGVSVAPLVDVWMGDQRRPLFVLLGAVGLLVILATASVSNLLLVQLMSRQGELSLRSALGASRLRMFRRLAAEHALLIAFGAILGAWLAYAGIGTLKGLLPPDLPRLERIGIGLRALGCAAAMSLGMVLLVAALLARRGSAVVSNPSALEGRDPGSHRAPIRAALVTAQLAVTTTLLVGAALLGRSLLALHQIDPGFRPDGILSVQISLPDERYPDEAHTVAFFDRLLPELRALPGITATELTSALPLGGSLRTTGVHAEGAGHPEVVAGFVAVSDGYFAALGIPLRHGRTFSPADGPDSPQVAVIDETLAAALWPGQSAVGKRLSRSGPKGPWMDVIGVAGRVYQRSLYRAPTPLFYSAYRQRGWDTMHVVVSSPGDAAPLSETVRRRVASVAPDLAVDGVTTSRELLSADTAATRLQSLLFALFAGASLLIAGLGLYAVVAFSAQRRVPEIGIRMALGATRPSVVRLILRDGRWPVAAGIALGLVTALAARDLIGSMLFGVAAADPVIFGAVAAFVLIVTLAAMYLPARRASRLDPLRALQIR